MSNSNWPANIISGSVSITGPVEVEQANPNDLNANANIQVGDVDVSDSNPVPIKQVGASPVTLAHSATTVGTSSVQVLASNASRNYAFIQNDSANVLWLKIGATAVANEGIRLTPRGGFFEMTAGAGNISTAAINAIADAASSECLATEGT